MSEQVTVVSTAREMAETDKGTKCVSANVGTKDEPKWIKILAGEHERDWFYRKVLEVENKGKGQFGKYVNEIYEVVKVVSDGKPAAAGGGWRGRTWEPVIPQEWDGLEKVVAESNLMARELFPDTDTLNRATERQHFIVSIAMMYARGELKAPGATGGVTDATKGVAEPATAEDVAEKFTDHGSMPF